MDGVQRISGENLDKYSVYQAAMYNEYTIAYQGELFTTCNIREWLPSRNAGPEDPKERST